MKALIFWIAAVTACFYCGCDSPILREFSRHQGTVTIRNASGEDIERGVIEVCGQRFDIGHMSNGQSKTVSYKVGADDDYHIDLTFSSGRNLSRRVGYVTGGLDFDDQLVVETNDIKLASSRTR
jgi:hypothetical protein